MHQVFVSYARHDAEFARRLVESLDPLYGVWLDHERIAPGARWQRSIEEGIDRCAVFLVVVSPESNGSDWVARETLLAERLGRYRIPVLVRGDLPLRLIDLQYVDFRAAFDGGLRDLLSILKERLHTFSESSERAHELIGAGVLAYLDGDRAGADDLVAQALARSPGRRDWDVARFWAQLLMPQGADTAVQVGDRFSVVERTVPVEGDAYGDRQAYRWTLELTGPPDAVVEVASVDYHLHPSFAPPNQVVRDRNSNFRIERVGWGRFTVGIAVRFRDGSVQNGRYELTFTRHARAPLTAAKRAPE